MNGLSSYTGSGSAGDGLERYFIVLNRLYPIMRFLGASCFFHEHSLAFKSPVEKHFMLGGMKKRTLLQLFHDVHALENEFELQELRVVWLAANRTTHPRKIT